jgi:hypothetical protein
LAALGGFQSDEIVRNLAATLLLLPLAYTIPALLKKPGATWPVVLIALAVFVVLRATGIIETWVFLAIVGSAVLIWGALHKRLQDNDPFRLQALGMLGFAIFAFAGLFLNVDIARYVVAAGWLAHGLWDLVHLMRKKVVAPSFAEWCFVIDTAIAIQLVLKI